MSKKGNGHLCTYCRRVMEARGNRSRLAATMDHVLPKSKGGGGPWVRKIWCCRQCNTLKADMMPEDWSAFMVAYPEWWKREEFKVPRLHRVR